ncbi:MAG TPA: anti-sigma factor RsbA family regulatory protein [Solirubrobacteraceae bacterium]|nr:anti-sigma factor RsbA family regulatory protein [Solirubrobacteraceae bacterium]
MRHDAFVYDSDDAFAGRMAAFLEEGIDEGVAGVAVTTRANCALLREALGVASQRVSFIDRDEWYVRPAHVLAGYDKTLRERLRGGASEVRVVGEVAFGATPREWAEWTVYESLVNHAFADRPAWIVCPYDARVLPKTIVDGASRTHPHGFASGPHSHGHYDDPVRLVRALTPDPVPLADLRPVPLADGARQFREQLLRELAAAGIAPARADEFVLAASEVFSNARRHGAGPPELRVGLVDERFVCEISDRGHGVDDPLAGYLPPKPGDPAGAGLWIARQLTSRLELIPSADGFTARLWL